MVLQFVVLELAGNIARFLPDQGLLTVDDASMIWIDGGFGLVSLLGGFALAEAIGGATLGKAMLGLRVTSVDGGPPGPLACILRALGNIVDLFIFGLVGYSLIRGSDLGQRAGDRWAGTLVIRSREGGLRRQLGWIAGLGFSLGLLVLSYFLVR